ncbi:MAG: GGDEF domain-containing protein, partial [Alphaproteobacteria bacterium]|nr:GGDEF domain-containing protein [Alphaproteobacteria bacterium]
GGFGGFTPGQGHASIDDNVSVLGIPKAEMTESVRRAIGLLLDEINALRGELARAKGHEAYLEEQAEKDRMLHVMRRRAFMARLGLAQRRVEEEGAEFTFLYFSISNAAAVRVEHGHAAVENLMVQASTALREGAEPGDVLGSLENFDFGLISPGTGIQAGIEKAERMQQSMQGRVLAWQGVALSIMVSFGVVAISPDGMPDDVIYNAKEDLQVRAVSA